MSTRIAVVTGFVFLTLYALLALFQMERWAILLFSISPLIVIYMAYRILKDPNESKKTFDEQFYEDWDYRRNR